MEEAGLTEEGLAKRLGVSADLVRRWEEEREHPTRSQFRRIAEVLKRPSAIFFLPEPPLAASIKAQFRQAPGLVERQLRAEEVRWLRLARRMQHLASWLMEQIGETAPVLPVHPVGEDVEDAAPQERARLGVPIIEQLRWPDTSSALRAWRATLEDGGILVLQLRIGREGCRGFSLWDERAPLIAVNTAYNEANRIYTLFHEYGHLLTRTQSACVGFVRFATGREDQDPERWCERFSAALLLPKEPFLEYLSLAFSWRPGRHITDFDQVARIATHFKVSLRAAALRLIELGAARYELYSEVDERARVAERRRGGGGRGMRRHERRLQEFGKRLPSLLVAGMERGILGLHDVLDYLDVPTSQWDEFRARLAST
jgi:Zn-dependent peptidase ImmA (M78 family)/transcriptional regulator with XRE-family HTH domain